MLTNGNHPTPTRQPIEIIRPQHGHQRSRFWNYHQSKLLVNLCMLFLCERQCIIYTLPPHIQNILCNIALILKTWFSFITINIYDPFHIYFIRKFSVLTVLAKCYRVLWLILTVCGNIKRLDFDFKKEQKLSFVFSNLLSQWFYYYPSLPTVFGNCKLPHTVEVS